MTITNGYLTTAEGVEFVGRNDTRDTEIFDEIITAASRLVDRFCGRHFYTTTGARVFDSPDGYCVQFGPFNDLVSATTVKYDDNDDGTYEVTMSASQFQLLNAVGRVPNTAPVSWPYEQVRAIGTAQFPYYSLSGRVGLVEISGTWGWAAVPPEVKQATRLMLNELVKLQDAPLGVTGGDMGVAYVGRKLPGRVVDLLAPFRHPLYAGLA